MEDVETIKAPSIERLKLIYDIHYKDSFFMLIGQPHRKFNWFKLRNEWSQQVLRIREADTLEFVHNFGGDNTEEMTWSYYDKKGRRHKKIFFGKPNQNLGNEFNEWKNKIDDER